MKNAVTAKMQMLQKLLPTWSAGDVGHTAGRDWYMVLVIALVIAGGFIVVDVGKYQETSKIISKQPDTLPMRGLPITEEKIVGVWSQFESRNKEFESYLESAPPAPALENAPRQSASTAEDEGNLTSDEFE